MAEKRMKGEVEMSDLFLDCLEKSDSDCRASQEDTTSRLTVSDERSCAGSSPLELHVPPRQVDVLEIGLVAIWTQKGRKEKRACSNIGQLAWSEFQHRH